MRLLVGVLVVTLGVIFLGANLDWFDGRDALRRFWPTALVAIGTAILLQSRERGSSRFWGLVWVLAGCWIFGHQEGWIRVEFWDVFFPLALVLFGGTLVWRALTGGGRGRRIWLGKAASEERYLHALGLMSGNVVRSKSAAFRGADLVAVMGGVTLDLSDAKLEGDEATVDVTAFWGGVEIRVPPEWAVTSRVVPLMGGYEDKTRPSGTVPTKRLIVRGVVIMGGVEVRS